MEAIEGRITSKLAYDCNEELQVIVEDWLASKPSCVEGRIALEVPLLLGMDDLVMRQLKDMDVSSRDAACAVLLERHPKAAAWLSNFSERLIDIDSSHYDAGAVLREKPPEDLPDIDIELRIRKELEKEIDPEIKEKVEKMLTKIAEKEPLMGLPTEKDEASVAKVAAFYDAFTPYLKHVIAAYQIGEDDREESDEFILKRLAEMEGFCFPRWNDDIAQLYYFRPKPINEDAAAPTPKEENPITVQDVMFQRLRNLRLEIVTRKLLQFGFGSVHEPNFLINMFSGPLGLRIDYIDDPYAQNSLTRHNFKEDLATFNSFYTPTFLIDQLTEHLISRQKQINNSVELQNLIGITANVLKAQGDVEEIATAAEEMGIAIDVTTAQKAYAELKSMQKNWKQEARDPLNINPQKVYEWLRENVATTWKEEEYKGLPAQVQAMKQQGRSDEEIQATLLQHGIKWEAGGRAEAQQTLENHLLRSQRQLNLVKMQVAQAKNRPQEVQGKLEGQRVEFEEAVKALSGVLVNLKEAQDPEAIWELLIKGAEIEGKTRVQGLNREIDKERQMLANPSGLDNDDIEESKKKIEAKSKEMEALKAVIESSDSLEERKRQFQEMALLPRAQPLEVALAPKQLKMAQINTFMTQEVYDKDNHFTRQAAVHLLKSMGVFEN